MPVNVHVFIIETLATGTVDTIHGDYTARKPFGIYTLRCRNLKNRRRQCGIQRHTPAYRICFVLGRAESMAYDMCNLSRISL